MKHLIDKDALAAEIERILRVFENSDAPVDRLRASILIRLLSFIDTLEVEELDLKDSTKETLAQKYINYTFKRHNISPESKEGQLIYYAYMHGMNQCLTQFKVQKGE